MEASADALAFLGVNFLLLVRPLALLIKILLQLFIVPRGERSRSMRTSRKRMKMRSQSTSKSRIAEVPASLIDSSARSRQTRIGPAEKSLTSRRRRGQSTALGLRSGAADGKE
jgi:hypothetical protein